MKEMILLVWLAVAPSCTSDKDARLQALAPDPMTYGCVKLCEVEYKECLKEYQKWACKMSLRRCVRKCIKEEEKRNKDKDNK